MRRGRDESEDDPNEREQQKLRATARRILDLPPEIGMKIVEALPDVKDVYFMCQQDSEFDAFCAQQDAVHRWYKVNVGASQRWRDMATWMVQDVLFYDSLTIIGADNRAIIMDMNRDDIWPHELDTFTVPFYDDLNLVADPPVIAREFLHQFPLGWYDNGGGEDGYRIVLEEDPYRVGTKLSVEIGFSENWRWKLTRFFYRLLELGFKVDYQAREQGAWKFVRGALPLLQTCSTCESASVRLLACSGCSKSAYCGRECQGRDWDTHKNTCNFI